MTIQFDIENLQKPWTKRQALFVSHYLADKKRDATAAAIKAGYSLRSAKNQAHRMMTHDDYAHIQDRIGASTKRLSEKLNITAEETLKHIAAIAYGNIGNYIKIAQNGMPYIDFEGLTDEDMMAIERIDIIKLAPIKQVVGGVEIKSEAFKISIKMHNKLEALGMLMKHLGLNKECSINAEQPKVVLDELELARRIAFILTKADRITKAKA